MNIPYAPLNTHKSVDENIWIVDGPKIRKSFSRTDAGYDKDGSTELRRAFRSVL